VREDVIIARACTPELFRASAALAMHRFAEQAIARARTTTASWGTATPDSAGTGVGDMGQGLGVLSSDAAKPTAPR